MGGTNDANVRYDDLCHLLVRLGYKPSQRGGSHRVFRMSGRDLINLQASAGMAKGYQVRQVRNQLKPHHL